MTTTENHCNFTCVIIQILRIPSHTHLMNTYEKSLIVSEMVIVEALFWNKYVANDESLVWFV